MAPRQQVYQSQITVPVIEVPQAQRVDVSSGLLQAAQVQRQREARQANEMRLEAAQKLEQLKGEADALPFDQRQAYFETNAQKIKGEFGKKFGPLEWDAKGAFHDEFDQMFGLKSIDVQASAKKGEEEHNYAVMDETLRLLEGNAARAGSEQQRQFFMSKAGETIANGRLTGAINEVQATDLGQKFKRNVEFNQVRGLIESDPSRGLQALQTNTFTNLKEEDRLNLMSRAESKIQHQVMLADKADRDNERRRKQMGEVLAKEGWELIDKAQMTDEWMAANLPLLDKDDQKVFREKMREGGSPESAKAISSLLSDVYSDGADVREKVMGALDRREINASMARSLLEENKNNTPARQAKTYLTTYLKPSDVNDSPAAAQSYAEAVAEFDRRFAQDPKQDAMELARTVIGRNSVVQFDKMTLVMPLPDYAVGGRKDFDEKKTQAATVAAYMARHNNDRAAVNADPAFKAEARKISAWAEAARKLRAAQEAAKGAPK